MTSNGIPNGYTDAANGDVNGDKAKKQFRMPDIIIKKRDGHALSEEEIEYFVDGVTNKTIQQAQLGMLHTNLLLIFITYILSVVFQCFKMSRIRSLLMSCVMRKKTKKLQFAHTKTNAQMRLV